MDTASPAIPHSTLILWKGWHQRRQAGMPMHTTLERINMTQGRGVDASRRCALATATPPHAPRRCATASRRHRRTFARSQTPPPPGGGPAAVPGAAGVPCGATLEKLARVYRVAPDPPPSTGGSVAVPGAACVPCGATLEKFARMRPPPRVAVPGAATAGVPCGATLEKLARVYHVAPPSKSWRACTMWRHPREVGARVPRGAYGGSGATRYTRANFLSTR